MKLNLTVINYMLPSHTDDLIIKSIESYGEAFWKVVDTNLVFKKKLSENVRAVLNKYDINFKEEVEGFWVSIMHNIVKDAKTDFLLIWEEDIEILDINYLLKAFEVQLETQCDFLPTLGTGQWNKIVDAFTILTEVEENEDFRIMVWGTYNSSICEQPSVKKQITTGMSTPYPISIDGIFKKIMFNHSLEYMMNSSYWKEATQPGYIPNDWAKNPNLPHSYEVFWSHNKRTEDFNYILLVPRKQFSTSIDPKDYAPDRSQIFQT